MEVVRGITMHTIVIVVDKPEKSVSMTTLLQRMGFKTYVAQSLYEGLRVIDQEMPHLVISDALLSDGTVGTLYDRLQQQPLLSNTPMLALVANKSKEQLTPLKGRKFAGFLLGKFDGKTLVQKVKEVLASNSNVSPYFVKFDKTDIENKLTLCVQATVLGKSGDQVIYLSESEVDPDASLVCLPDDSSRHPALLKMGTNIIKGEDIYNIFPLSRIKGKGRRWLCDLPDIRMIGDGDGSANRRLMFYDPNMNRFEQFKEVLSGYNMELIHMASIQAAASFVARDSASVQCIYLDELPSDSGGIQFKEALSRVSPEIRPPVIAGTGSLNARSTSEIRFIRKPFGLGVLVEMIDAAFKSKESFTGKTANLGVTYQAPAKILGLDETGGIIQIKFPMLKGTQVRLEHSLLHDLWDGENKVDIIEVATLPGKPDVWQAKFVANRALGNKAKYWERVQKALEGHLAEDPQESA
ncbi:response regulator [Pseudobacteriovorax antillogorgiicola]|uniref:Response regulator receiver domain-containing protein n=1 Tax=Pseudobacteriovorax antillogorgiicola TaxID=1513793 RepID=A0A1Y6CGT9_9BACT|nr:response regulator [Pseudobacteriovorax antillogorgiicola]TCS48696.1 response regulator receiver domain-containing protein [Pseudobacteriovorax antillogorgiicola]SMF54762.1 Response regulator receiver domain-containing protein [Pseudobacteriovorax antillogorgiicola]